MVFKAEVKEILDHSAGHKSLALLANIEGQPAVLKLEKKAFMNDLIASKQLMSAIDFSKISHSNDIYYKYQLLVDLGSQTSPSQQDKGN